MHKRYHYANIKTCENLLQSARWREVQKLFRENGKSVS